MSLWLVGRRRRRQGWARFPGCFVAFVLSFLVTIRAMMFLDAHPVLFWRLATLFLALGGMLSFYGLRRARRELGLNTIKLFQWAVVGVFSWATLGAAIRTFEVSNPIPQPKDDYARQVELLEGEIRVSTLGWNRFKDWQASRPGGVIDPITLPGEHDLRLLNSQLDSGWETFKLARDSQSVSLFLKYRRERTRQLLKRTTRFARHEIDTLKEARALAQVAGLPEEARRLQQWLQRSR